MKPWNNQRPVQNHPSPVPGIKERHNLFFYATLVVIAVLFIIASPGQAAGTPPCPPSCDPAPDENILLAPVCPAGTPGTGILPEPEGTFSREIP